MTRQGAKQEKVCGSCAHFQTTANLDVGDCRRYPPTAVVIAGPTGKATPASIHPPVKRHQSCGEWIRKGLNDRAPIDIEWHEPSK